MYWQLYYKHVSERFVCNRELLMGKQIFEKWASVNTMLHCSVQKNNLQTTCVLTRHTPSCEVDHWEGKNGVRNKKAIRKTQIEGCERECTLSRTSYSTKPLLCVWVVKIHDNNNKEPLPSYVTQGFSLKRAWEGKKGYTGYPFPLDALYYWQWHSPIITLWHIVTINLWHTDCGDISSHERTPPMWDIFA